MSTAHAVRVRSSRESTRAQFEVLETRLALSAGPPPFTPDQPAVESTQFLTDADRSNPRFVVEFDRAMDESSAESSGAWEILQDGSPVTVDLVEYDPLTLEAIIYVNGGERLPEGDIEFNAYSKQLESDTGAKLRGHVDYAATAVSSESHRAAVHQGLGDGSFRISAMLYTPEAFPSRIIRARLNGDDIDDLVTGIEGQSKAFIYFGLPEGEFEPATELPLDSSSWVDLASGDLNGDGMDEIVVTYLDNLAEVFINDGTGEFPPAQTVSLTVPDRAKGVAIADFDGTDGLDIAIANEAGVHVYLNSNNSATFSSPQGVATGPGRDIASAFVDDDEFVDLVVTRDGLVRDIVVLYGNGDGSFDTIPLTLGVDTGRFAIPADVTSDGIVDIVYSDTNTETLRVLAGDGNRGFTASQTLFSLHRITDIDVGDLNNDGRADVLATIDSPDSHPGIVYFFANGSGLDSYTLGSTGVAAELEGSGVVVGEFDDQTRLLAFEVIDPEVVGRHVFYNQSAFDGGAAIDAADDGAIATDKSPYVAGSGLAQFSSVTSYSRGINGIMIDVANVDAELALGDFSFKVGNNNSPEAWSAAPTPSGFSVRPGAGVAGSDRITITWATGDVANSWLEVTVRGNDAAGGFHTNTGLVESDVAYWGNRIADSGTATPATSFTTTTSDSLQVFVSLGGGKPITDLHDFIATAR